MGRRTLSAQLLILFISVCVGGVIITGGLSYLRSQQQTREESQAWAMALARLAAKSSAGPVIERDYVTLEFTLQEIASLPGLQSVQVVSPGGQAVLRISRQSDGSMVTNYPRDQHLSGPGPAPASPSGQVVSHATLISARAGHPGAPADPKTLTAEGWVEVTFSHRYNMAQSNRNWLIGSIGGVITALIGLLVFYGVLQRSIRPIGELAEFATCVAARPGGVLKIHWRSREVRELGLAINWASQELADRMQDAQQKLARLRAVLDTAADAIVGVAADGRIVTANPAAERIFGHRAQVMLGQPLESFLAGMHPKRMLEALTKSALIFTTNTRIGQVEWMAQRGGDSVFPVELLIGETRGDPEISFTCIVRDLSEAKQAKAHLALYERVIDCALNGIMISHARQFPQPIAHVNPAFTLITGYTANDVLGLSADLLRGPNTDAEAQASIDSAMQTGAELTLTLHHHRQDGSPFYNKLSVSPVRDAAGEITHYVSVIEDVSSQIEIKRQLIERTARLNATFNLSPDGFAVFDAQGTLVSSNPALLAMVGQVPDRCTLQAFDSWFRTLCEDHDTYPSIFSELHETSRQVLVLSHPVRRVLERELRHNLRGSGETFLYFRDITHQFEVNRMKSEFLTTAAHELRTPLASIVGFTELMIHRRYSEEKQKDLLQTVHRQGTLLSNVVQDLLDISRIEARQGQDFRIVPTSLVELIRNALDGVANEDLGRAVCVGKLPQMQVMADPQKIQQALGNLLDNAFKYSLGEAQVALDVSLSENAEGGWACIAVSDQGVGMKPDQLARAFERFYRADRSGHIPGTGLGLNLVKEIAEIHGGSVTLESSEGVGTVARLSLRLASQALVGAAQDVAPAANES